MPDNRYMQLQQQMGGMVPNVGQMPPGRQPPDPSGEQAIYNMLQQQGTRMPWGAGPYADRMAGKVSDLQQGGNLPDSSGPFGTNIYDQMRDQLGRGSQPQQRPDQKQMMQMMGQPQGFQPGQPPAGYQPYQPGQFGPGPSVVQPRHQTEGNYDPTQQYPWQGQGPQQRIPRSSTPGADAIRDRLGKGMHQPGGPGGYQQGPPVQVAGGAHPPPSGASTSPFAEMGGGGHAGAMPGSGGISTLPGNGMGQRISDWNIPDWATPSWSTVGGMAGSALGGPLGGIAGSWLGSRAGGGQPWWERMAGMLKRNEH